MTDKKIIDKNELQHQDMNNLVSILNIPETLLVSDIQKLLL